MEIEFKERLENYKVGLEKRKNEFEKYLLKFVLKHIKSKQFIENYYHNIHYYMIPFKNRNRLFFQHEIFTTLKEIKLDNKYLVSYKISIHDKTRICIMINR